jgi:EAL domain-containing protein (putative c-di-GMP-specific phosphodiesterase class I)
MEQLRREWPHLLARAEIHLESGTVRGIELVPKWNTSHGVLTARQVAELPLDREFGLAFDGWLLRQACGWARAWRGLATPPVRVSIPVLGERVWDNEFRAQVSETLGDAHLAPGTVDLQIPEARILGKADAAGDALEHLRQAGATTTLAEFGSGLISLPQLRRLVPDRLKIHPAFVRNVASDLERASVARSIVALAHTLGLTVIADDLATERDVEFFRWEGCDFGQGEVLARSLAVSDVHDLLSLRDDDFKH